MDRQLLHATLRVLSGLSYGPRPSTTDTELVRGSALPEESDLDLEDLARRVAQRSMGKSASYSGVAGIGVRQAEETRVPAE